MYIFLIKKLFRNLNTSVFTTATSSNMKPLNLK